MFRAKRAMLLLTCGTLLQFGGCGAEWFNYFWRTTWREIPVGFGRALGTALEPITGITNLLGGLDLTTLLGG